MKLLTINELYKKTKPIEKALIPFRTSGVYFLFSGKSLVYVGTAKCILRRLAIAHSDKCFDRCAYIAIKTRKRLAVEREYIRLYKPEYNAIGNKRSKRRPRAKTRYAVFLVRTTKNRNTDFLRALKRYEARTGKRITASDLLIPHVKKFIKEELKGVEKLSR